MPPCEIVNKVGREVKLDCTKIELSSFLVHYDSWASDKIMALIVSVNRNPICVI